MEISKWLTAFTLLSGPVIPTAHAVTSNFTGSVPLTPTVPAAASAVGYNTLTFNSTQLGTTAGTWRAFNFYGHTQPPNYAVQNPDGSILLGSINNGGGSNATISTAAAGGNSGWSGVAFGGGFFARAVISFTGQASRALPAHPAWWALDIEHTSQGPYAVTWPIPSGTLPWNSATAYTQGQCVSSGGNYYFSLTPNTGSQPPNANWCANNAPYNDFFEIDFMEYDVSQYAYQNGIGNWWGPGGAKSSSTSNPYQGVHGIPGSVLVPNTTDFSQSHFYDCLWVPATATTQGYLKFYFDGVQTGSTFVWNQPTASQLPPPINNSTAMNGMDRRHLFLILGSGTTMPMTVHSVQVWQSSAANNVNGSTVPISITTITPPKATQSQPYSYQIQATGGTGSGQTWFLHSETGANTWAISSSGLLTGIAGTAETDTLVVTVTDGGLYTAKVTLSVTVNATRR
jgi:hypothetical protein